MPKHRRTDRRVQRTRALLHGALASLIHEKPYDAIVVKEILARANVGRSTFYTHFRDKDQLLERSIADVLRTSETASPMRSADLAEQILGFSLPMLEHIEGYRGAGDRLRDVEGRAVVHAHLEGVLVDWIAQDVRRTGEQRERTGRDVRWDLLARYVASTFVLVLDWWANNAQPLPARKANDLFRALTLPTLKSVVG